MTRNVELRKYCKEKGYVLEKCKRKGCWIICLGKRPDVEEHTKFRHAIEAIGYEYFQDCLDPDGSYWVQITSKKKLEGRYGRS